MQLDAPEGAAMGGNGQARGGSRLPPCNDEQRRQCPPGPCHRVRSGISHKVSVFVVTAFRMHRVSSVVKAVNCVF
ncbi:hypothetical protein B9Z51_15615 [Limnohabitans sp. T6-5]|nr:hypothetical protein B9Z51_15615 [Limnohabitans sp. T6-5]